MSTCLRIPVVITIYSLGGSSSSWHRKNWALISHMIETSWVSLACAKHHLVLSKLLSPLAGSTSTGTVLIWVLLIHCALIWVVSRVLLSTINSRQNNVLLLLHLLLIVNTCIVRALCLKGIEITITALLSTLSLRWTLYLLIWLLLNLLIVALIDRLFWIVHYFIRSVILKLLVIHVLYNLE